MTRHCSGRSLFVTTIALLLVLVFALLAIGCSGSSTSSSTTTGAGGNTTGGSTAGQTGGANAPNTNSTLPQRVVAGAKSDAEYKAEIPKLQEALKSTPKHLASLPEL